MSLNTNIRRITNHNIKSTLFEYIRKICMPKEELVIWNLQFIYSILYLMISLGTNLDVILHILIYLLATLSTQGMVGDTKI